MSLETPAPTKTYRLGLIAAKTLDDPGYLDEMLGDKATTISHILGNGANPLVATFAQDHGIPYTVWPLTGGRSLPWSNSRIIEGSDYVLIVATPQSKSAAQAAAECVAKQVKHRVIQFEPCQYWRQKTEGLELKVQQVGAVLAVVPAEDVASSQAWVKQLKEIV